MIATASVLVLAGGVVGFFYLAPHAVEPPGSSPSATGSPSPTPTPLPIGGGVPVEEERETEAEPPVLGEVTPFISSALLTSDLQFVNVRAFVPGLSEEGGTCTATVTGPGVELSVSAAAFIEVATTTCPVLTLELGGASAAGLTAVVRYDSTTSAGVSEPVGVTP